MVARYTLLLKAYGQKAQDASARNQRLPLADTPEGLSVAIGHETRPAERQVLLAARYLMFKAMLQALPKDLPKEAASLASTVEYATGLELAGQITPDSPAFDLFEAFDPEAMGYIAWHASGGGFVAQTEAAAAQKAFAFLDAVFARHPNPAVKRRALETAIDLHSRPRMLAEVRADLARLEAFDPQAPAIRTWKAWLVTAEKEDLLVPRPGRPVPAFKLPDVEHPGAFLTPASFKGKYVLLDFWATWCAPCRGELPNLHKAYAAFHPRGLEVLSISSDRKAADVVAFRKDKDHPMPWRHAFPEGEAREAVMRAFQVRGIPHMVLVGPDGTILATEGLRGEDLQKTLGKYLGNK